MDHPISPVPIRYHQPRTAIYYIRLESRDVVLCCTVQRLACYERSDFLKVTRNATNGYEPFNCSNVREGYQ